MFKSIVSTIVVGSIFLLGMHYALVYPETARSVLHSIDNKYKH